MTRPIKFTYTNWRGITTERTVIPQSIKFTKSHWHGDSEQWIMYALDVESGKCREFSMIDIEGISDT